MVNDEGTHVAWVPRWELLETLLDASDTPALSLLLVEHRDEILEDCAIVLADVSDPAFLPFMQTVQELLPASRYGLWKVAAISTVAITHSFVERLEWVSARQQVRKHHALNESVALVDVTERATRGPLVLFFDWNPKSRLADRDGGINAAVAPSAKAAEQAELREAQKRIRLLEQENET